MLMKVMSVLK